MSTARIHNFFPTHSTNRLKLMKALNNCPEIHTSPVDPERCDSSPTWGAVYSRSFQMLKNSHVLCDCESMEIEPAAFPQLAVKEIVVF